MRASSQRLADLLHGAQQPRLAMEADVETDKKTRKRTEDAAANRMKNGGSSSARIDDGPTSLTSFGMIAKFLLMTPEKCIGDVLVDTDAEAPTPYLPPMEMRMLLSTSCGLLSTDTACTAMKTCFSPSPLSWTLGHKTKNNQPYKLQPACPSLLEEGHRNQTKANSRV